METTGSAPTGTSSAIHGPGYSGNTPFARLNTLSSGTTSDFHIYGVEWNADAARFSVDGATHYTVARDELQRFGSSILPQGYFVILNLAVGGQFDGDPQSDGIFPATMLVDWVRVYSK